MKNLFLKKGDTNWLGVVLVSAMIGALTSWVIMFVSDSVLEISAPDSATPRGNTSIGGNLPADGKNNNTSACGLRIMGRQFSETETQQCQVAGGTVVCGTIEADYVNRPGTSDNFCECDCGVQQ